MPMWRWFRKRERARQANDLTTPWCSGVRGHRCTASRIAGFMPVCAVLSIIMLVYITAVPYSMTPLSRRRPLIGGIVLIIFHFVFLMVVVHYLLLVYMDPGGVPEDWKEPIDAVDDTVDGYESRGKAIDEDSDQEYDAKDEQVSFVGQTEYSSRRIMSEGRKKFKYSHLMEERTHDGNLRFCHRCRAFKPDRSHHCSSCDRCILRMDHHCIFINNCVSFYTYKFFLGFISYAFVGCLMVCIFSFRTFTEIAVHQTFPPPFSPKNHTSTSQIVGQAASTSSFSSIPPAMVVVFIIGYIMSSAFAFALSIFVCFHGYLLLKGRTTIEMYELHSPRSAARIAQYDLGPATNIRNACGTAPLFWFFPTRAFVEGNGLVYERIPLPLDRSESV